jgi:hypothetical protein
MQPFASPASQGSGGAAGFVSTGLVSTAAADAALGAGLDGVLVAGAGDDLGGGDES